MKSKHRHGFSLVEIVIALGIASFSLIAIVNLLAVGLKASREANTDTTVTAIIQTVSSRIRSTDDLQTLPSRIDYDQQGEESSAADAYYRCDISIGAPNGLIWNDIDPTHLRNVELKVSWPEGSPNPESLTLQTSVAVR